MVDQHEITAFCDVSYIHDLNLLLVFSTGVSGALVIFNNFGFQISRPSTNNYLYY